MATKQSISLSHWGAFVAEVTDGKLTKTSPFADAGSPSPMVSAWPDMVYSKVRIEQPMVRRGYLDKGPDSDRSQRGREPFVPVSWDQALDLAASTLQMVKTDHGNEAILGGSYGWSSAGRFHHARTQIRRFLFSFGGCVDQAGNYSWGAAQFILPHVIGNHRSVSEEATSWKSIAENASLLVALTRKTGRSLPAVPDITDWTNWSRMRSKAVSSWSPLAQPGMMPLTGCKPVGCPRVRTPIPP